jgi:hypothetical protein
MFSASPWTSAEGARSLFGPLPAEAAATSRRSCRCQAQRGSASLKRLLDVQGCRLADLLDDLLVDLRGPRSETLITLL